MVDSDNSYPALAQDDHPFKESQVLKKRFKKRTTDRKKTKGVHAMAGIAVGTAAAVTGTALTAGVPLAIAGSYGALRLGKDYYNSIKSKRARFDGMDLPELLETLEGLIASYARRQLNKDNKSQFLKHEAEKVMIERWQKINHARGYNSNSILAAIGYVSDLITTKIKEQNKSGPTLTVSAKIQEGYYPILNEKDWGFRAQLDKSLDEKSADNPIFVKTFKSTVRENVNRGLFGPLAKQVRSMNRNQKDAIVTAYKTKLQKNGVVDSKRVAIRAGPRMFAKKTLQIIGRCIPEDFEF